MIKKLLVTSISGVMLLSMSVNALAAGSINANEQKILDELKAKNCPARYIIQATNYMEKDSIDITEKQSRDIIAHIDAAGTAVDAAGITTEGQLKKNTEVLDKVIGEANAIGDILDLTIKVNRVTGAVEVYERTKPDQNPIQGSDNKQENLIAKTDSGTIKKTGTDSTPTYAVVSVLGLAVAAMAVITKKSVKE